MMGARVTVNGETLASRYDGVSITALAGLSFDWGRESIYEEVDPGILRFRVVDRDGTWSTDAQRVGQAVTVERTGPDAVIFRGTIASAKAKREKVRNPSTRVREPVWIVEVQAASTLADLGMAVFAGNSGANTVEGIGGWSEGGPTGRINTLLAAGANSIVSDIERPNLLNGMNPPITSRLRAVDAKDGTTALELVETIYKCRPLGFVDYDPETNAISLGKLSVASNVVLTYTGGRTSIVLPTGRVIDARKVATPEGYQAQTTVADAIDVVEHDYSWYGKDPALSAGSQKRTTYIERVIQASTARANGRSRRVLKIKSGVITLDATEFGYDVGPTNAYPGWLLAEAVKVVNSINNQLRLPVLRFDDKRLPLADASLVELIYRPMSTTAPLYFAGSVFNTLRNAGPQYQVIGGTLTYDDGWTHDVILAPARSTQRDALTWGATFGSSTATWAGFYDSITWNDFNTITTGLPA